jgi:hypothetical protein
VRVVLRLMSRSLHGDGRSGGEGSGAVQEMLHCERLPPAGLAVPNGIVGPAVAVAPVASAGLAVRHKDHWRGGRKEG